MNFDKIKKVNDELNQLDKITEKLNHWKKNYFDKYPGTAMWDYFEMNPEPYPGNNCGDGLDGPLGLPITSVVQIPSIHRPNNAVPQDKRIEYYSWMINFLAERRFNEIALPYYQKELTKPLGKQLLHGEYERIKRIQTDALKQLKNGEIDLYSSSNLTGKKLYLWYMNNYYSQVEFRVEDIGNIHVKNVCTHKYVFPYLKDILGKEDLHYKLQIEKNETISFNFTGLIATLSEKEYFEDAELEPLENWFNGTCRELPINIKKPMNHFVSIVASLVEENIITNTKRECYRLIRDAFLFKSKQVSLNSIENAMKSGHSNRITSFDKVNFIDIKQFLEKK